MIRSRFLLTPLILAISWMPGATSVLNPQESLGSVERVNRVNVKLKKAKVEAEITTHAPEVWSVLDEELISYLNQVGRLSISELNREIEALFRPGPSREATEGQTECSVNAKLYGTGLPNVYLATYEDYFWTGTLISTLRLLEKVGNRWQVIARMEQTTMTTKIAPEYRARLKAVLKEKESLQEPSGSADGKYLFEQAMAFLPFEMNNLRIAAHSINPVGAGGLRFVSVHSTRGAITAFTVIEWEWAPGRGMEAVAWIWGDQWTHDEQIKGEVGKWQSMDKNKNSRRVTLKEFLPN